jgi:hypothetical protein
MLGWRRCRFEQLGQRKIEQKPRVGMGSRPDEYLTVVLKKISMRCSD